MKKRNLWALDIGLPGWHQVCLIASLPLDQEHQLPRWICGPNDSFCLPQTWSILFAGKIYEATCRPRSKPLGLISSPGWAFLAAGSSFELGPGRFLFSCSVHQVENYNRCKIQRILNLLFLLFEFVLKSFDQFWTVKVFSRLPCVLLWTKALPGEVVLHLESLIKVVSTDNSLPFHCEPSCPGFCPQQTLPHHQPCLEILQFAEHKKMCFYNK